MTRLRPGRQSDDRRAAPAPRHSAPLRAKCVRGRTPGEPCEAGKRRVKQAQNLPPSMPSRHALGYIAVPTYGAGRICLCNGLGWPEDVDYRRSGRG